MTVEEVSANMEKMLLEIKGELAAQKEQIKGALRRIDEQAKLTESVHELALSVQAFAVKQDALSEKVADTNKKLDVVSTDVEELKQKPAKRWDESVKVIIGVVITAVATYFITMLGLK